jgi:hypothetical protein
MALHGKNFAAGEWRMQTRAKQNRVAAVQDLSSGRPWALLALAAVVLLCGCRISTGKNAHDDVSIDTPMGGLSVKRDSAAVLDKVGLPSYPGAQPVAEGKGNHDSANVDLSFGGYKLQVLVVKLRTPDDAAKVQTFYRQALSQYSDVIACHDNRPIGTPASTGMGLTCSKDKHVTTIDTDEKTGDVELKAGSPSRQHIVAIRTRDGETTMDLVSLDLPKGMVE